MNPSSDQRFEEFWKQGQLWGLATIRRELIADSLTPLSAYSSLVGSEEGFILESVEQGEHWSRFSFIGRKPLCKVLKVGQDLRVDGDLPLSPEPHEGILEFVDRVITAYRCVGTGEVFESGLVGYLSYDIVREVEDRLVNPPPQTIDTPDAYLLMVGELAIFDHLRQRVTLVKNVFVHDSQDRDAAREIFDEAERALDGMEIDLVGKTPNLKPHSLSGEMPPELVDHIRHIDSATYKAAVAVAKENILDGDIFQVVLSQRFEFRHEGDPLELYRALRLLNPSPYMYFLKAEGFSVVGSSPEALVRVDGAKVLTRPIAGTRPRGKSLEEDRNLAAEFIEHPKEIAEHVMLVDLARNDIGKVSKFSTVKVDEFMVLEKFSHVMHLTSTVSGVLKDGVSPMDVVRATVPAGTLSGAPKVRAMEIIDELEIERRGIYGGVFGYFAFDGNLDVAIVIRTAVVLDDGRAFVQAGAGIVADSDPELEDLECINKAKAILSAAGLANSFGSTSRDIK